ncbi:MAG: FAD-dependent oxidoreductase [Chromatiales bacterium]|nr:FAD-dependent oxidoreductase [Gammaproteobacteria bacterium]MCP5351707.1 FAD-dependent oxidoreductase [Chromatiales bacterium]
MRQKVAIIGSGISGLATAWLLRDDHDVTLFERDARLGGHSHTVEVGAGHGGDDAATLPVDTGFMVFNHWTYPNLVGLFDELGVATQPCPMSFSVSADGGRVEWAGTSLDALFAQRRNLVNPRFLGMLRDIARFNRLGVAAAAASASTAGLAQRSLREWLDMHRFGDGFRDLYLLPMAAAIWSSPTTRILDYPVLGLLRFFANHGLLSVNDRPQWHTPSGGSRVYVQRMAADIRARGRVVTRAGIERVERLSGAGVRLHRGLAGVEEFDQVVMACHADQALALLANPSIHERLALQRITYQPNRVYLHADPALMPRRERAWAAWNYRRDGLDGGGHAVSVTYWMSLLQSLPRPDVFVSLNPVEPPRDDRVFAEFSYAHPLLDQRAAEGQRMMGGVQGRDRIWFAGAWLGNGFHEDGLNSALAVANAFGVRAPWQTAQAGGVDTPRQAEPVVTAGSSGLDRAA